LHEFLPESHPELSDTDFDIKIDELCEEDRWALNPSGVSVPTRRALRLHGRLAHQTCFTSQTLACEGAASKRWWLNLGQMVTDMALDEPRSTLVQTAVMAFTGLPAPVGYAYSAGKLLLEVAPDYVKFVTDPISDAWHAADAKLEDLTGLRLVHPHSVDQGCGSDVAFSVNIKQESEGGKDDYTAESIFLILDEGKASGKLIPDRVGHVPSAVGTSADVPVDLAPDDDDDGPVPFVVEGATADKAVEDYNKIIRPACRIIEAMQSDERTLFAIAAFADLPDASLPSGTWTPASTNGDWNEVIVRARIPRALTMRL
jgi:hypothetical protein